MPVNTMLPERHRETSARGISKKSICRLVQWLPIIKLRRLIDEGDNLALRRRLRRSFEARSNNGMH